MMIKIGVPFYFLGTRNYVNGLTIFKEMLKIYLEWKQRPPQWLYSIELFRINRFIRNQCLLEIHQGRTPERKMLLQAAARMRIVTADSQRVHLLLIEKDDRPVRQRRADYDRGQYIHCITGNSYGGTDVKLCKISDIYTYIIAIVEVNYRFCCERALEMNVSRGVSWAYLNGFRCPFITPRVEHMHVRFLKESTILLPGKVFIVRQFALKSQIASNRAEIGFFFDLPSTR